PKPAPPAKKTLPVETDGEEDGPAKASQATGSASRPQPETDVPAEAAKLLDQVIDAARRSAGQVQAAAKTDRAPDGKDDAELPPEPEAPEPIQLTVKAAIPPRTDEVDDGSAAKARELRSGALKAGSVAAQLG